MCSLCTAHSPTYISSTLPPSPSSASPPKFDSPSHPPRPHSLRPSSFSSRHSTQSLGSVSSPASGSTIRAPPQLSLEDCSGRLPSVSKDLNNVAGSSRVQATTPSSPSSTITTGSQQHTTSTFYDPLFALKPFTPPNSAQLKLTPLPPNSTNYPSSPDFRASDSSTSFPQRSYSSSSLSPSAQYRFQHTSTLGISTSTPTTPPEHYHFNFSPINPFTALRPRPDSQLVPCGPTSATANGSSSQAGSSENLSLYRSPSRGSFTNLPLKNKHNRERTESVSSISSFTPLHPIASTSLPSRITRSTVSSSNNSPLGLEESPEDGSSPSYFTSHFSSHRSYSSPSIYAPAYMSRSPVLDTRLPPDYSAFPSAAASSSPSSHYSNLTNAGHLLRQHSQPSSPRASFINGLSPLTSLHVPLPPSTSRAGALPAQEDRPPDYGAHFAPPLDEILSAPRVEQNNDIDEDSEASTTLGDDRHDELSFIPRRRRRTPGRSIGSGIFNGLRSRGSTTALEGMGAGNILGLVNINTEPVVETGVESGIDVNFLSTDGEEPLPTARLHTHAVRQTSKFETFASSPSVLFMLRLLSVVPSMAGTLYLLCRVAGFGSARPGGTEEGSRVECAMACFWSLLTALQCFLLTSGLTRRWLAYYPLVSTLVRLLSLQTICWPLTSITLRLLGPSRPLVAWVAIGTFTSLCNTIRIYVTSNITTYNSTHTGRSGSTPTPSSTSNASSVTQNSSSRQVFAQTVVMVSRRAREVGNTLVDAVIGGEDFGHGSVGFPGGTTEGGASGAGGNGGETPVKGMVRTKRRMNWGSVLRQCVWPNLVGYFLTGWYLLVERDLRRRMDGLAGNIGE
ncbi:N-glycosylation protein EOS1 [Phaffia rhodozyma]|uniref:N-glycosylation protein EOS1 n=1 Tax=Phaffia rhodozyma TaxID=264483 RepID=A0A0F7SJ28_PHARH|nr:N-glycosylation protein EOS1 [Phaffia rhodozyma]